MCFRLAYITSVFLFKPTHNTEVNNIEQMKDKVLRMLDEAPERTIERLKRGGYSWDKHDLAFISTEIENELSTVRGAVQQYLDNPLVKSMNSKQPESKSSDPLIRELLEATQSQKIDIEALSDVMFGLAAEFAAGQKTASMTQLQMRKFLLNLFKQG